VRDSQAFDAEGEELGLDHFKFLIKCSGSGLFWSSLASFVSNNPHVALVSLWRQSEARSGTVGVVIMVSHVYERLAILLVKGNAALFLNRLPNHPSPLIDGSQ